MWRDESFIPPLYSSLMISLSDSVPFRCFTYPKTLLYDTSPSVSDPSLPLLSVPRSMNRKSTYIVPHDSVPDPMTPVYTCDPAPVPNTHSSRAYDDLPDEQRISTGLVDIIEDGITRSASYVDIPL